MPTLDDATLAEQVAGELVEALAERHPALAGHLERSAQLATQVGFALGLDSDDMWRVSYAARLHDIGKVAVPSRVLDKPGPLDPAEWRTIKRHTIVGGRILESIRALEGVAPIVRASHERFDGEGYPDRLAGDRIPLEARIVFACDAYDAMTSDRPYQASVGGRRAMLELQRCSGSQFDPMVVTALSSLLPLAA
jgi:HD-GYP domain-containing protein (c-di-GMP phosphodiesterase class II)